MQLRHKNSMNVIALARKREIDVDIGGVYENSVGPIGANNRNLNQRHVKTLFWEIIS